MSKILLTVPSNGLDLFWYEQVAIPKAGSGQYHEWRSKKLKKGIIDGIVVGNIRIAGINTQNLSFQTEIVLTDSNNSVFGSTWGSANKSIATNVETVYTVNIAVPGLKFPEAAQIIIRLYWTGFSGTTPVNNEAKIYYGALAPNITGDSYFEFPQPLFEYEPPPNEFRVRGRSKIGSPFVLNNLATNGSRVTSTRV